MNTKDYAKKNGKKTEWVRERCKEGMIPSAEKRNGRWDIPEDAELPPCTGREAALILENLLERNNGMDVCLIPARMAARGEETLSYLINWGFIERPKADGSMRLANRGIELLEASRRVNKASKKADKGCKTTTRTTLEFNSSASAKLGPVNANIGANYHRETVETRGGDEKPDGADKKAG